MSFISTFEELSKLYESVEPKATEEAVKEESEELDEGIFDSKATKQKKYEQEVTDAFKASSVRLASEVASNAGRVIEQVSDETSAGDEGSAAVSAAKNIVRLLKSAIAEAKGKTPLALVKAIISIGAKYKSDADGLDELKEFASKVLKLSDLKTRQYLMEKVNAAIEKAANQTITTLKKEFGITESLEEEVDEEEAVFIDEAEDAPAEEAVEEPIEEESIEEPKQLILECANCGGLVIKTEADVAVDEESDLANVEDACQYCEEAAGYKIVGVVASYEATEEEEVAEEAAEAEDTEEDIVEESLLDVNLPIDVDVQANGNEVSVGTLG